MPRILIIEDEASLRENLLDFLDAEGFEVIGAENGQMGIERAQAELPDLIICDVLMPELDGYAVLRQVRQNPQTALIPFIFLTAKGTVEDFRSGMRLGADDYLTKPCTQAELLHAITTRLTKQARIQQLQQTLVQQLQQKIADLQASNLLKDDFLSMASHELRSPITNIKLAVQMLQHAAMTEQQQQYLDLLWRECDREIALIDDLLNLQQLEASSTPPALEMVCLQDWLPPRLEAFINRAQARQQSLALAIAPDLPSFPTDRAALERILGELLNNACKYTAPGGQIELKIRGKDPICIWLRNQAELPAEELPRLFDRFYRVPDGDPWQQGGTGLGLALVKKLVERLQGSIQVASQNGWVQFTLQLPFLRLMSPDRI